jgi:ABC-2 type transport system ATP-binding protein
LDNALEPPQRNASSSRASLCRSLPSRFHLFHIALGDFGYLGRVWQHSFFFDGGSRMASIDAVAEPEISNGVSGTPSTSGPESPPPSAVASPQPAASPGDAGEVIIQTVNLRKEYRPAFSRQSKVALEGLSIDVKRGEIFGLVGPNGSGKTTTLKLLLGLIKPTKGDIEIFGRGPRDVAVKQRIGFLPDGPYFYDHLNSYEVLDFYGKLFGYSKAQRDARKEELLDMVGLNKADRSRVIRTYSKGMMQRVGLAQSLINDPELLFLDEPTTGLDPIGARQMKDAILAVRDAGKTVLLCSHLLADVQAICDRVAICPKASWSNSGRFPSWSAPRRASRSSRPDFRPKP